LREICSTEIAVYAFAAKHFSGWEFLISLVAAFGKHFRLLKDRCCSLTNRLFAEQTISIYWRKSGKRFAETIEADDIALNRPNYF